MPTTTPALTLFFAKIAATLARPMSAVSRHSTRVASVVDPGGMRDEMERQFIERECRRR